MHCIMVPHKGFLSQAVSVSTDLSRGSGGGHQEMTLGLFGNQESRGMLTGMGRTVGLLLSIHSITLKLLLCSSNR